jgi:hypothetical protein
MNAGRTGFDYEKRKTVYKWSYVQGFLMMKLKLSLRKIYKEATKSRVANDEVEVITSKDLQGSYKIILRGDNFNFIIRNP